MSFPSSVSVRSAVIRGTTVVPVTVTATRASKGGVRIAFGLDPYPLNTAGLVSTCLYEAGVPADTSVVVTVEPVEALRGASLDGLPFAIVAAVCFLRDAKPPLGAVHFGDLNYSGRVIETRGRRAVALAGPIVQCSCVADIGHSQHYTLARPLVLREERVTGFGEDFSGLPAAMWPAVQQAAALATTGHGALLVGALGSGATMLARRLGSVLPDLTASELRTVAIVHSVAALRDGALVDRPFRAPHYTISPSGLSGGGRVKLTPGEVSLAHAGVLYLDELPEFKLSTLELLAEALKTGTSHGMPARPAAVVASTRALDQRSEMLAGLLGLVPVMLPPVPRSALASDAPRCPSSEQLRAQLDMRQWGAASGAEAVACALAALDDLHTPSAAHYAEARELLGSETVTP